jgi:fumarate hydratase subunit beta
MATYSLDASRLKDEAPKLRTFDRVLLSGTIYTARDAAHKKIMALLDEGKGLPFPLAGACIYYAGPTQAPDGLPIGSCGPTTSGRMDVFAPRLLDLGLGAMIGKGERSGPVVDAIVRNRALYLCAVGGAGALACKSICSCEVVAFEELGCESVKRLELKDFPLIVAIDSEGNDIFKLGRAEYLRGCR